MARTRSAVLDEETRDLALTHARIQVRTADSEERFDGHASVVNQRTAIGNPLRWGFYEQIRAGAFTKTLGECDARMLIDHDSFYVVSRMSAGTLRLNEDAIGLHVDSALDEDLSYVRDLKANIRNGNISGMSFGFYVVKDEWTEETVETNDGNTAEVEVRDIIEVRLIEVSAVAFPAYPQTDAGLRQASQRQVQRALQHRGMEDQEIQTRLGLRGATIIDMAPESKEETAVDTADQSDVESQREEPAATDATPQVSNEETEPAETTRVRPSDSELAQARLAQLKSRLRSAA